MADTLVTRDIFVRHTTKEGKTFAACHRVWDAERFLAARRAEATKEGGKAAVAQITEDQYRKERA